MKLKISILSFSLFVSGFAGSLNASDYAPQRTVEIPLERVFIARYGFDDNDNVQAVVQGYLPNSCYSVSTSDSEILSSSKKIVITQKAIRQEMGECSDQSNLPPVLAQPIPFWREVNMGMLVKGDYRIIFNHKDGVRSRDFHVEPAPTTNVDSMRYALLQTAFVAPVINADSAVFELHVTGYVTSSCAELSDEDKIEIVDDIYVYLPSVEITSDYCLPVNKYFHRVIKLQTPELGHYLFHARSQAGQSLNVVFEVK